MKEKPDRVILRRRKCINISLAFLLLQSCNPAVTVACHVIPASGRLVDVDIPEQSESPWPGSDIF